MVAVVIGRESRLPLRPAATAGRREEANRRGQTREEDRNKLRDKGNCRSKGEERGRSRGRGKGKRSVKGIWSVIEEGVEARAKTGADVGLETRKAIRAAERAEGRWGRSRRQDSERGHQFGN
jgi:hypothetical protein